MVRFTVNPTPPSRLLRLQTGPALDQASSIQTNEPSHDGNALRQDLGRRESPGGTGALLTDWGSACAARVERSGDVARRAACAAERVAQLAGGDLVAGVDDGACQDFDLGAVFERLSGAAHDEDAGLFLEPHVDRWTAVKLGEGALHVQALRASGAVERQVSESRGVGFLLCAQAVLRRRRRLRAEVDVEGLQAQRPARRVAGRSAWPVREGVSEDEVRPICCLGQKRRTSSAQAKANTRGGSSSSTSPG